MFSVFFVKIVVANGTDLDVVADSRNTALFWAAGWRHADMVEVLIRGGRCLSCFVVTV